MRIFLAEKHEFPVRKAALEARQTPAQGMENLFMETIAPPA